MLTGAESFEHGGECGDGAARGGRNGGVIGADEFRACGHRSSLLNQWRMAELHAQEAPARVWELETWGALFDRT
ncbi:hypothetical protein ACWDUE_15930, partial [Streptomyces albogriseolus]